MTVRQLNPTNDIEKVIEIEQIAWGESAATKKQILQRSLIFPEGSLVVENSKQQLIGYAVTQLVEQISTHSWAHQTDNGYITNTHRPNGTIVYGVSMSALPEGAHYDNGVASAVIMHYYNFFIKSGKCSVISLGSRLPGFYKWHQRTHGDINQYLAEDVQGLSRDPELRLYQKNGFHLLWKIPEYYPDPESLNYGAMIFLR